MQFRGIGQIGEEIVVKGSVTEVADGVAKVESEAEQAGQRIIRNGSADGRLGRSRARGRAILGSGGRPGRAVGFYGAQVRNARTGEP